MSGQEEKANDVTKEAPRSVWGADQKAAPERTSTSAFDGLLAESASSSEQMRVSPTTATPASEPREPETAASTKKKGKKKGSFVRRLVLKYVDESSIPVFFAVLFVCVVVFVGLGVLNVLAWMQLAPLTAMYTEVTENELSFPNFVVCHTYPNTFNFRPDDWELVQAYIWDDGLIVEEVAYDFVNSSSMDRGGDGVCLRVHAEAFGKVPGTQSHLQLSFAQDLSQFYKNACPWWNDLTESCPMWPLAAQLMPDSYEVLVEGSEDAHVWIPSNAINNIFITPTKQINLRGDKDIDYVFAPVTQYYVVIPEIELDEDRKTTYLWFNYPSRHMMVHRKYAQRSLASLYAILFALLATVTSFFSFFLYKEGDMDPGKYIIKKRFFKAHRAQIALRRSISRGESLRGCIDEVCAAVDGDAGGGDDDVEDGDGESPSIFVSKDEPK